jgi:GAF domain-containing protein/tetratricopeptide (TPR) repeat protein
MTDAAERLATARLDLEGGCKAKGAAAYEAAAAYFASGMELLGARAWEEQRELAFALLYERAGCAYLSGHFGQAEALFDELLARAQSDLERARVHELRIVLYVTQGRFADALSVGREALALLSEPLPMSEAVEASYAKESARIAELTAGRTTEEILSGRALEDPARRAALRVLMQSVAPAYQVSGSLLSFVCARMARLSLEWGCTEVSPFGFVAYAAILTSQRRYEEAFAMGELALQLFERMPSAEIACKLYQTFGGNIHCFGRPLKDGLFYLERAQREGLATGDFPYLSYACFDIMSIRLGLGEELGMVEQELEGFLGLMEKTKDAPSEAYLRIGYQIVRCLRGRTRGRLSLSDRDFEETIFAKGLSEKGLTLVDCRYHAARLKLALLFGDLASAEHEMAETERLSEYAVGQYFMADAWFHGAIVAAALLTEGTPEEKARRAEALARREKELGRLTESCPANFRHKWLLVQAEMARAEGRDAAATDLFEAAIEGAHKSEFVKDEAIALERACEFHLERGRRRMARSYLADARRAYQTWGARTKVEELTARYEGFWDDDEARSDAPRPSPSLGSATLDAATVIRASQAIAGEILLDRVLSRVMRGVLESAGAERGVMLLERGGRLRVEAMMSADPEEFRIGSGELFEESGQVPHAVADYVRRTKEPLMLRDARSDRRFAKDPYVEGRGPRSVLCVPMLLKGRLLGMLYLEHRAARDAFTPARTELVSFLASQATTAVDHALLYAEVQRVTEELSRANEGLEEEVARRTKEMRETAQKLRVELQQRERAEKEREALQAQVIAQQRERLLELSTPLIPITDDLLVMPLIGSMDEERAGEVMEAALRGVAGRGARAVIIDVTGVRGGDVRVAEALVQAASALRLLGSEAILTGMRPEVARAIVGSGVELKGLVTKGTLQAGIAYALRGAGLAGERRGRGR